MGNVDKETIKQVIEKAYIRESMAIKTRNQ